MKKVNKLTCWTDYPIAALGDAPGKRAPVRQVEFLHYDGNKYAKVQCGDAIEHVKCGYLYSHAGRYGQVRCVNRRKLERMFGHSTRDVNLPRLRSRT